MRTIDIYTYPTGEDPYYKARHKVAVMEAFNDGAVVECWQDIGNYWQPTNSPLWYDSCKYRIAKAKSPIAGGHNPTELTEEIVGDGYRLLTAEEIEFVKQHGIYDDDIQYWGALNYEWFFRDRFHCFDSYTTCRTSKPNGYYLKATFLHWVTILLPEPYRALALANMKDDIEVDLVDRYNVLSEAFQWSITNEGYDFWHKVDGFINGDEDSLPEIPKAIPLTQENVPTKSVLVGSVLVKYEKLIGYLYSIDNGKSWSPCVVEV